MINFELAQWLSGGKPITLIDCTVCRASGLPGFLKTSQEVSPRLIAYDVHFPSAEEVKFTSLAMRYSNLEEWTATTSFDFQITQGQSYSATVQYVKPESVSATLSTGLKVEIAFSVEGPNLSKSRNELRIAQHTWLTVESPDERPFEELVRVVSMLADLISLGVGVPIRPIECQATAVDTETPPSSHQFRLHQNSTPIAPIRSDVHAVDMLFLLKDLRPSVQSILESWCVHHDSMKPLYSLYFGTLRSPSMYVEHKFHNIFQALEAYDRRTFVPAAEAGKRHEERLHRILASVEASKDKDWLKGKLRYSHEPSATDRLRRLVKTYSASWLFEDPTADINLAGNLRNYHTHFDQKLETSIPPVEERPRVMHNLFVRLQLLCELILLQDVGFDGADPRRRMEATRRLERRLVP